MTAAAARPMTVVVADDDELLLTALSRILDLNAELQVVGLARTGREAVNLVRSLKPDLALLDLDMPELTGIEAAALLSGTSTAIVIVTRHSRPAQLTRALAAGARAFILKSTSSERLVDILRDVHQGQRYIDPEIAALAITARDCPLTDREVEVLDLIRRGHGSRQIADQLHLAPGTVRNYISSAIARLGVSSGREAAEMAYAEGWI